MDNLSHSPNYNSSSSEEHLITQPTGYVYTLSNKILGHGSYGNVYLAKDENNKEVAVKCCEIGDIGIPNLMEASMMSSIQHYSLNTSFKTYASSSKIYIIQDKAKNDLAHHTRQDKDNKNIPTDVLRKWFFDIAQAIYILHSENIIHADVKAGNVLLFNDGNVKLTDFTLSVKQWDNNKFKHNVCTCTHRPIECLTNNEWDKSLDIWSLGCTFYEIAYGELLFPYQGTVDKNISDKAIAKNRLRLRCINTIIHWGNLTNEKYNVKMDSIDYMKPNLTKRFKRNELKLLNDLIYKMLKLNPSNRITIEQVLNHGFFHSCSLIPYKIIKRKINEIDESLIGSYIDVFTHNPTVKQIALSLYARCNDLDYIEEYKRIETCVWIATKLTTHKITKSMLPPADVLKYEIDICHNLSFHFI